MKRFTVILVILAVALSLCACISSEPTGERYPELADMLDAGDYEGAMWYISDLYDNAYYGDDNGDDVVYTEPAMPTEEEWDVLYAYRSIYLELHEYLEDGSVYYWDNEADCSYSGSAALGMLYNDLTALDTDVIDKWVGSAYTGTDYMSDYDGNAIDWDYDALAAGFTCLQDVLLKQIRTRTDNMENVNDNGTSEYTYDIDGNVVKTTYQSDAFELVESNPWGLSGTEVYTYDDTGVLTQIKYMSGDNVNSIVTLTYDGNGNVVNEHIKENDGEWDITYAYDDQGRLVTIGMPSDWDDSTRYEWNYTYDSDGNMVKEEYVCWDYRSSYDREFVDYKKIREFTYDSNGGLVSGSYKYENWGWDTHHDWQTDTYTFEEYIYSEKLDQYSFTTDEQARPLSQTILYGDTICVHGDNAGQVTDTPSYVSQTVEFIYGDYWFFALDN